MVAWEKHLDTTWLETMADGALIELAVFFHMYVQGGGIGSMSCGIVDGTGKELDQLGDEDCQ